MSAPARARILVVDDDDTTRMLSRQSLGASGFEIVEAEDGDRALEVLEAARPDLVLLDVDMPGRDGFETCRAIRERPEWCATPVLMMTATDDSESIDRAYAAGATDFATKPLNWHLLRHRLRYLLRGRDALSALDASRASLARSQRMARVGSWEWDAARARMSWSDELYRILGTTPREREPTPEALIAAVPESERPRVREWWQAALTSRRPTARTTHGIVHPGEGLRTVDHLIEQVRTGAGEVTGLAGTVQDVTERARAEARVRRLAYFDGLTGLPNRESFIERLGRALAARRGEVLAVLYVDLDDFKRINDTLGHGGGDRLLAEAARRLTEILRGGDSVVQVGPGSESDPVAARLGGDEFCVLLRGLRRWEDASRVAERIIAAFSRPFRVDGNDVYVSTSIGIATSGEGCDDAECVLRHADMAMYAAKRTGKRQYRFFDGSMSSAAERRLVMDQHLRRALERDELTLVYQPQVAVASGEIVGAEALLRWHHDALGTVSPAEFVPLAEETGLIVAIGEWVLRAACAQAVAWRERGLCPGRMAVNISPLQFMQPGFVSLVAEVLAESGLEPGRLELEITESMLAEDVPAAVATLEALKAVGVGLSVDDFGTGYSSLAQLRRFPVDRLKIDGAFIRDLTVDRDDDAIVAAIVRMAHGLAIGVVAEGVETEVQLRALAGYGCEEYQGYWFSRPVSARAFEALRARSRAPRAERPRDVRAAPTGPD